MTLVATDYDADIAAAQRACSVDLHRYLGERFGKREDRLRPIALCCRANETSALRTGASAGPLQHSEKRWRKISLRRKGVTKR